MDQYNTLTPEIISKLKAVSDHILTGDDINPDFSRDEIPQGRTGFAGWCGGPV